MTAGRVIAVVGPSGVGKDSVMAALTQRLPQLAIVCRAVTRPPGSVGEAFRPLTAEAFETEAASGGFCLHWRAHGLRYGIPAHVRTDARKGQSFLVNLSRGVLAQGDRVFDRFVVLSLTATPETLAVRLAARGRETAAEIAARLSHTGAQVPAGLAQVTVANDGPLADTVQAAAAALFPEGRAPGRPACSDASIDP